MMKMDLERLIRDFTAASPSVAIAESTDDIGCTVYSGGTEMPAWASHKVEELVGLHPKDGAVLTTRHDSAYFLLSKNDTENFQILRGPLKSSELVAYLSR
jgi:hypothetical protein